jgi:glycine amidinotransferase/scyllo-inosamine-4-phosphate amidinotransferase 1
MKIIPSVNNEWESLRTVILGTEKNAQVPPFKDKSLHAIDYANYSEEDFKKVPTGPYPQKVIEETEEDLLTINQTLIDLGVEVLTVNNTKIKRQYNDSYYDYCPRDSMLVIGDKVISTPMSLRQRRDESDKYKKMFIDSSWVQFPKPLMEDSMYSLEDLSRPTLMDGPEPVFDAANVLKANYDILYLISNTGNVAGAVYLEKWLKENVSNKYKVHMVKDVYAYIHIDTTFVLLREGLVLCNPTRVNSRNLPEMFKNWDVIWAPEPYPTQVMTEWCPASPWLGMNILSINENLVMVEEHQVSLMNFLKKYNIDSIPVKLRHARTLSGGPHCITLDVVRGKNKIIETKKDLTLI